ncbi:DUF4166 domain-containing protein [Herbidospora cretacea]|uniref:DUF4166 domain-containing protein n=1 Tax=Herbidospora cretacea TaxID=28444 RepID=UPI0007749C1B|nr:DUF4166 domain-containing protein [Herbidospora cretacea]
MTSIFRRAMGPVFERLHPELRRRFDVGVEERRGCVGTGVMDRVWHSPLVRPFLLAGAARNVLVPDSGRNVPFRIENLPYVDSHGRETVTFVRTFELPRRTRRFDATMVYDAAGGRIVDFLGSCQHLATDLAFSDDGAGGLVIRSGELRFSEGWVSCRVPRLITGRAVVRESYDEGSGRFRIRVTVANPRFGPLFGYRGTFAAAYVDMAEHGVPARVKPRREQARL